MRTPARFFHAIVICSLCARTSTTLGVNGTPTWFGSQVSTLPAGSYASTPTLAFDHYGTPSIAWSSIDQVGGPNVVRQSQLLGLGMWNHRQVISGNNLGLRTSLSFDRAERPLISWLNSDGSVQGQFNVSPVQSVAGAGSANSAMPVLDLSHDLAGTLRGMFSANATGQFSAISHNGTAFSSGSMLSLSGVTAVRDASIITSGSGLRQFVGRADLVAGSQGVVLASEPAGGGAWSSSFFATADAVTGVDITRDPVDGRTALAYTTFTSGTNTSKLFFSKFNGFVMQTTEILSSTSNRYEDVSIAYDFSDGRPAIAYERKIVAGGAEQLMFAYLDGNSTWQHSLVDSTISFDAPNNHARKPSLAFDDYGTSWPAIAYVDSDGSLMTAFDPPAPEPAGALLMIFGMAVIIGRRTR